MQLEHVFTLANRLMKRPPLTVASVALSLAALLGSTPAFAMEFVEGVWNAADGNGQFEFYDSRLNDNSYFASLAVSSLYDYFRMYNFNTSITPNNPYVLKADADHERVWYSVYQGLSGDHNRLYSLIEYREGVKYQDIYAFNYYDSWEKQETNIYERRTFDGGFYESDDPAFVASELSSSLSTLPSQDFGIFDFEQSFIHFSNGNSQSLTDFMRQHFPIQDAPIFDWSDVFYAWLVEVDTSTSDVRIEWSWLDSNHPITGITLAYNLPVVPEPETWVMLLAGLGIVGAAARRRLHGKSEANALCNSDLS